MRSLIARPALLPRGPDADDTPLGMRPLRKRLHPNTL